MPLRRTGTLDPVERETALGTASPADRRQHVELKVNIHEQLLDEVDLERLLGQNEDQVRVELTGAISHRLDTQARGLSAAVRTRLIGEILDEVLGFGPIQPLIDDPSITEVMVNRPDQVYIERNGRLEMTDVTFRDAAHVMRIIQKIVTPLGRRVDESSPMVDARLPDGSRVNAIIPPLSIKSPTLTIRKFSKIPFTADDLVSFGTMTPATVEFLQACVRARLNILISGGTGSGKTTTLGVLSNFIPESERVVTIEDAAELQLRQPHVVTLESRPSNLEGKGEITIRNLFRNSLRMRPDRIIVGEVRGQEALDMLQAMNTGHDGSLTTAHCNSPRDAISRVETMVLMAGTELPSRAIREQIASALDLIVHQQRFVDGSRKLTHITEVQGMEGNVVTLQDIFKFQQSGFDAEGRVQGRFRATGLRPTFMERFQVHGIEISADVFDPGRMM